MASVVYSKRTAGKTAFSDDDADDRWRRDEKIKTLLEVGFEPGSLALRSRRLCTCKTRQKNAPVRLTTTMFER